jgi:hypothetical protein
MKTPVRFCDCPERCRRGGSPPKHDSTGHTGCRALSPESFSSTTTASKKRVRDLDRTKDVNKNLKRQKREQPEVKGVKANKENVAVGDPKVYITIFVRPP